MMEEKASDDTKMMALLNGNYLKPRDIITSSSIPGLVLSREGAKENAEWMALVEHEVDRDRRWPWLVGCFPKEDEDESTKKAAEKYKNDLTESCDTQWEKDGVMFRYCIVVNQERVGGGSLVRLDWDNKRTEIGYELLARFEGNGYVTETVKLLENEAFNELGLHRIEIRVDERNVKSRAVAERCGYKMEGILQQDTYSNAEKRYNSTCVYAKLNIQQTQDD